jgi:hypothetical protein
LVSANTKDEKMTKKEGEDFSEMVSENFGKREGTSMKRIEDRIYVSFPNELLVIDLKNNTFGFSDYEG